MKCQGPAKNYDVTEAMEDGVLCRAPTVCRGASICDLRLDLIFVNR